MGQPSLLLPIILTLTLFTHTHTHTHTHSLTTPPPTLPPTPTPTPTLPTSSSTLDPKQLKALQSLNIPTSKDPCSNLHNPNTTLCDNSKPFRHIISLKLVNCSDDVSLSITALKSLPTLQHLSFTNCPTPAVRFPTELATNLRSFTCIDSLGKLTGVWLARLVNVTDLTVTSVPIKATGPYVILGNLKKLNKITLSHANLTGFLPKSWHPDISYIDLSYNQLKGKIPSSVTELENLSYLDVSGNRLTGEIPTSIGDLIGLKNLSLSANLLSGSIPESMASMPDLEYIDLSSNQLNGSIPNFLNKLKGLKYLNLEKNNFQGIMPFNGSFIKKLAVFKIGDNANLCYNHSSISSKVKLGIAQCDKNGIPLSPPASPGPSSDEGGDSGDDDSSSEDETSNKDSGHHGPNKVVLGIAIALSSIVFLIIFLICLSKRCA